MEWVKPVFDAEKLSSIVDSARSVLDEKEKVRDQAIKLSRDVIRYSGWAITAVHKGSLEEALDHLARSEEAAVSMLRLLEPHPDLYYSGMAYNAISEYVEARLFIDIVTGRGMPGPEELGVPIVPYLQGLGDLVGELRRLALEKVRTGDFATAWRLLEIMESVYINLRGLDYPDALAPGIRKKADTARRLVDDTKAFLVDMESRIKLVEALKTGRKE